MSIRYRLGVWVLAGAALMLASALALLAFSATAQDEAEQTLTLPFAGAPITPLITTMPAPAVIGIDGDGQAVLRGVVVKTGTTQITVHSWGGWWTVRTGSDSAVISNGETHLADLSALSLGDFVGVQGAVAWGRAATIDAWFVRNWTTDPYLGEEAAAADEAPSVTVMPTPQQPETDETEVATTAPEDTAADAEEEENGEENGGGFFDFLR